MALNEVETIYFDFFNKKEKKKMTGAYRGLNFNSEMDECNEVVENVSHSDSLDDELKIILVGH